MKTKKFDCVAMKRTAAEKIYEQLKATMAKHAEILSQEQ